MNSNQLNESLSTSTTKRIFPTVVGFKWFVTGQNKTRILLFKTLFSLFSEKAIFTNDRILRND